ncbi:hypothetical protein QJS04_geneDACA021997 [Acorus gramineus]|uniref:Uncharacterized protein n=1 Tax=Acorus gramineus TaxID=55184 RepID=A0AAV8ZXR0_ACOGR|nr:hypothetical protein QJS04_geneDACA021997 [Acorus gramineus]
MGVDKDANKWTFDTNQFDNILKKLKVQVAELADKVERKESETVDSDIGTHEDTTSTDLVVKATRPQGREPRLKRTQPTHKVILTYMVNWTPQMPLFFKSSIQKLSGRLDEPRRWPTA